MGDEAIETTDYLHSPQIIDLWVTMLPVQLPFKGPDPLKALENDEQHHILFNWPSGIELAVQQAMKKAFEQEPLPSKFFIGRRLSEALSEAGFVDCRKFTSAMNRSHPLRSAEFRFLQLYLRRLKQIITPYLPAKSRDTVLTCLDEGSSEYLLEQENLEVAIIDHLALGKSPHHIAKTRFLKNQ